MPHYVLRNTFKTGVDDRRTATRPAHLAYLNAMGDRLLLAGPLLGRDGTMVLGSMIIIDMPDLHAAEKFAQEDPYALAGLFETMEQTAFRKVLPV